MFHSLLSASYPELFCCVFDSSFDFWGEVSIAQSRAFPSRCAIRCAAPLYARRADVACNVMGCDHGHGRSHLHAQLEVPWSR